MTITVTVITTILIIVIVIIIIIIITIIIIVLEQRPHDSAWQAEFLEKIPRCGRAATTRDFLEHRPPCWQAEGVSIKNPPL